MKHVLRILAALGPIVGLTLVATGCAPVPVRSQTQLWYEPADGVSTEAGDIDVRGVLLVSDEDGGISTVLATFANTGPEDEFLEVHVGDRIATPPTGPVKVPEGGYARLGPDQTRVDVFGADARPGEFVDVEFVFRDAPRAQVQALVQRAEGDYEGALDDAQEPTPTPF